MKAKYTEGSPTNPEPIAKPADMKRRMMITNAAVVTALFAFLMKNPFCNKIGRGNEYLCRFLFILRCKKS